MINYIDLVELMLAFYFSFLLTLAGASYYFSRKYIKQEEVFESIKNLDKEIKEIKNLIYRNHEIQENNEGIFNSILQEGVFGSIKNLDKEIKEIKNLIYRNHEIQEYLIKNQENNEGICNSFKITFSKINAYSIENNKLLNIISRKINKSIKE